MSTSTRFSLTAVSVLMLVTLMVPGCGKRRASRLEEGLSLYRQNKLEEARPLLEGAVEQDPQNPDARAWLAETQRRLEMRAEAIASARKALEMDPCHTFAHTVLAWAYNPMYDSWEGASADTAWHHLLRAAQCDSTDGNIWIGIWVEAIRRRNPAMEKKALRLLLKTEFFAPALLAYNRWMLRHLPKNAVLLTNGDMDTYPAVALQEVEHFRPDVAVVNRFLLNTTWYARFLRDRYELPLPFDDDQLAALKPYQEVDKTLLSISDQIIKGWLSQRKNGAFPRPIAISVTVGDLSFAAEIQDHLKMMGAFYSWLPEPTESRQDTAMLRSSLAYLNPDDFRGPFVSQQDRSPVRRAHTNRLVTNIAAVALHYSQGLIQAGRTSEALEMLRWVEEFESKTEIDPVFTKQIQELRENARRKIE
jgi:tetratricopeptide (TPR) repeat protein